MDIHKTFQPTAGEYTLFKPTRNISQDKSYYRSQNKIQ